ncbi:MAG: hypothetical protein ABL955_06190 [Elusimicrobiota bacterium]
MSDQNKSNLQAFGAGLLGFVAVMAIGGGALMVRSSQQAKSAARPDAAAAPIDLGASMPRSAPSSNVAVKERRAESPAPLLGEDESEGSEAPVAAGAASDAEGASLPSASSANSGASQLKVTQHLDKPGNGSSAVAIVKNTLEPEKAAKAESKKAAAKLDATGGGANAIAAVHYGVTSRSELMGRAAGPVYNFKGNGKTGGSAPAGKLADEANAKMVDLNNQLKDVGLPPEMRAKLMKDLEDATKKSSAEKPAQ